MLDIYATLHEIRQILRSVKKAVTLSHLQTEIAPSKGNPEYGEILHSPIKLYLYVPP